MASRLTTNQEIAGSIPAVVIEFQLRIQYFSDAGYLIIVYCVHVRNLLKGKLCIVCSIHETPEPNDNFVRASGGTIAYSTKGFD